VIEPTGAVRVMVATKAVDFRKGAEGLAALVREDMKSDPFSRAVHVLRALRHYGITVTVHSIDAWRFGSQQLCRADRLKAGPIQQSSVGSITPGRRKFP
jgi:hypothetical protein